MGLRCGLPALGAGANQLASGSRFRILGVGGQVRRCGWLARVY